MNRCIDCGYFEQLDDSSGDCRAMPPQIAFLRYETVEHTKDADHEEIPIVRTYWPQVHVTSWCGQFQQAVT